MLALVLLKQMIGYRMDWDDMARPWLEAAPDLEVSFEEVLAALFDAAKLQPGEAVLDVGCGTGPTLLRAADAVGKGGQILGIDVAPPLIARARERVPANVDLVIGDAGTHPYPAQAFDAIIANFGIMFFEDNDAAFRNLRSAVKPGGRLVATFWSTPPENPWFAEPRKIVDQIVPNVPRPDPAGPGPMRFGDPSILSDILGRSGWAPEVQTLDLSLSPPGPADRVAELHMKVTIGMMLRGVDVDDATLAKIRSAIVAACQGYQNGDDIRVPARIHVVNAKAV